MKVIALSLDPPLLSLLKSWLPCSSNIRRYVSSELPMLLALTFTVTRLPAARSIRIMSMSSPASVSETLSPMFPVPSTRTVFPSIPDADASGMVSLDSSAKPRPPTTGMFAFAFRIAERSALATVSALSAAWNGTAMSGAITAGPVPSVKT